MTSSSRSPSGLLAGAVLLLALGAMVVSLQIVRERHFPAAIVAQQALYVTSPALVSRLALSYDALVADIYWIRAIQYYGGTRLSATGDTQYDLLYPLLDLTTSLDPSFNVAYRFGALFLSEPPPGGAGRPDLAVRLLKKGIAAHPERWEYWYDTGFVYYRHGDYARAAEWFRRAHQVPGAANWLGPLAAVTLATGGDIESSRLMWRHMLETADEPWIRSAAEHRLLQLDAVEAVMLLERVIAAYTQRYDGPPADWIEVIRAGLLRELPRDPAGVPFVLDPMSGRVTVSAESPMWPLPTEGPR